MGWYGGYAGHMWGHGGPWMIAGPLFGLFWLAVIALGAYLVIRYVLPRRGSSGRARDILDERYARGELTSEEYRERVDHLR